MALGDRVHDRWELPLLRGEGLLLRPARDSDAQALTDILREPGVALWWGHNDIQSVRKEMRAQPSLVISIEGAVAGWLHVHEETDPDYPSVAFDIALTAAVHGRGYAQKALRVAIRHFIDRGHHRFTIDPAADNERAVRSYTGVGFKPVGILRAYERAPDGRWRDGLLMDLLAAEFNG